MDHGSGTAQGEPYGIDVNAAHGYIGVFENGDFFAVGTMEGEPPKGGKWH